MGLCRVALILLAATFLGCVMDHPGRPPIADPARARELFHIVEGNASTVNGRLTKIELEEIFEDFDMDGDQVVQRAEFITMWVKMGMGDEISGEHLFSRADTDKDGALTIIPDLDRVFHYFDIDGDGAVTEMEFVVMWSEMSS